jgi:hypothetical protein
MRIGLLIPATLAVALSASSFDAGFPGGGGGHGGMDRGMRVDAPSARAATKTAADRIAAVVALLDDTQKTLFLAGLGEAFAGAGQRP